MMAFKKIIFKGLLRGYLMAGIATQNTILVKIKTEIDYYLKKIIYMILSMMKII
jgi:hypothetical protein